MSELNFVLGTPGINTFPPFSLPGSRTFPVSKLNTMEMRSGAVSLLFQGGVGIPETANHFSVSLPRCNPMPPGKGS